MNIKRSLIISITIICVILIISVIRKNAKETESDHESLNSSQEMQTVGGIFENNFHISSEENDIQTIDYQFIIRTAEDILSGNGKEYVLSDNIRISIEFDGYNKDYQQLGYCITDINDDGVDELVFGVNPTANNSDWKGYVYDIYTDVNGKTVQLADGAARYHWFICDNGVVLEESSSNGFSNGYSFYSLTNGELKLIETVIKEVVPSDEDGNNEIWLYSNKFTYENHYDTEQYDTIDEEEAAEIMNKYKKIYPEFIPFG